MVIIIICELFTFLPVLTNKCKTPVLSISCLWDKINKEKRIKG